MFNDLQPIVDPSLRGENSPIVIAGPCSAETRTQVLDTARSLAAEGIRIFRAGIWKPRTKPGGFEGIGAEGLPWLAEVKAETGMLISTEVANRQHVIEALDAGVDLLWIGARTTTNPFAVQEIADTLAERGAQVAVLVKNPLNPDIELWIGALQRIYNAGIRRLGAVHRGFSTYGTHLYRNMPQWHIPIELRRRCPELPIICDPSHIGGKRELIAPLSQQALDMGFDGLIIESHLNPDCAWSDSAQQITPEVLSLTLSTLTTRRDQTFTTENLSQLRRQIDELDNDLLEVLGKRLRVCREIGQYKKEHGMPIVQTGRYDSIMQSRVKLATEMGMSADFMSTVLSAIHQESVRQQLEIYNRKN